MHDDVKQELLLDNAGDPAKEKFVELLATPLYDLLAQHTERRFIKTHFPFSLLPPSVRSSGAKVNMCIHTKIAIVISVYTCYEYDY